MKKSKLQVATVASAVAILLASCGGQSVKNGYDADGKLHGEITISGAFALYPLAVKWTEEFQKTNPGVKIDISAGGAGKGMTDALGGLADFGMVSRELAQSEIDKGGLGFAVAKDAVVATLNKDNPDVEDILRTGITIEKATKLWITEEYKAWGQFTGSKSQEPIHVYNRSDACGAAETFAKWFGKKQEDLNGTAVFGDPGLAAAIQKDKYGIGFNNVGYAYDESGKPNPGLVIVPIDINGNGVVDDDEKFYDTKEDIVAAIADGRYPSPPARDLYLVSNGLPKNEAAKAFLKYVLTDGQKLNLETGYTSIAPQKIQNSLDLLK